MKNLMIAAACAVLVAALAVLGWQYIECREAGGELLRGLFGYVCR